MIEKETDDKKAQNRLIRKYRTFDVFTEIVSKNPSYGIDFFKACTDKKDVGNKPNISVYGRNLAEAYEKALIGLFFFGHPVPTHYDKPDQPQSIEATVTMEVENAMAEPRYHLLGLADAIEMANYVFEIRGGHDHWVDMTPETEKWPYTYSDRLRNYKGHIDQIENCVRALKKSWHNKRVEAITWEPDYDLESAKSAPCLQRLWFRLLKNPKKGFILNMDTEWRSRDAFRASHMNMFGVTTLQSDTAKELEQRLGQSVSVGTYTDKSNSLHLYGSADISNGMIQLIERVIKYPFESRVMNSNEEVLKTQFDEEYAKLEKDPDYKMGIQGTTMPFVIEKHGNSVRIIEPKYIKRNIGKKEINTKRVIGLRGFRGSIKEPFATLDTRKSEKLKKFADKREVKVLDYREFHKTYQRIMRIPRDGQIPGLMRRIEDDFDKFLSA